MKPFIVIADVDLVKDITVKHFDKFANRLVSDCTVCIYCLTSLCLLNGGSCTGQAKWIDSYHWISCQSACYTSIIGAVRLGAKSY